MNVKANTRNIPRSSTDSNLLLPFIVHRSISIFDVVPYFYIYYSYSIFFPAPLHTHTTFYRFYFFISMSIFSYSITVSIFSINFFGSPWKEEGFCRLPSFRWGTRSIPPWSRVPCPGFWDPSPWRTTPLRLWIRRLSPSCRYVSFHISFFSYLFFNLI